MSEELQKPVIKPGTHQRTPAQLEVLAKAREKANQIRKENAQLRKAQKELAIVDKAMENKALLERYQNELGNKKSGLVKQADVIPKD